MSSGMLRCGTGGVGPEVLKRHNDFVFKRQAVQEVPGKFFLDSLTMKIKATCPFETSETTPTKLHHIAEDMNPQHVC
jgi:hypothetical protein